MIKILNMEKEYLRKFSPFLDTFFGDGEYSGSRQFFKFVYKYFESYLFHL